MTDVKYLFVWSFTAFQEVCPFC